MHCCEKQLAVPGRESSTARRRHHATCGLQTANSVLFIPGFTVHGVTPGFGVAPPGLELLPGFGAAPRGLELPPGVGAVGGKTELEVGGLGDNRAGTNAV